MAGADNSDMDCETCRVALSARLDGEAEPVPAAHTDRHVEACAACWAWQHDAAAVTRSLRVRPTVPVSDFAAAIVAASERRVLARPRVALGLVGAMQVALGLTQVVGVGHSAHPDVSMSAHLFNESTAWNLALGLGLLWTALRPRAVSGVLPVVAGFVAVLATFSVHDLVSGVTSFSRVATHGILIVGLALLVVVRRGDRGPTPATPEVNLPDLPVGTTEPDDHGQPPISGTRGHRLRPIRGHAA